MPVSSYLNTQSFDSLADTTFFRRYNSPIIPLNVGTAPYSETFYVGHNSHPWGLESGQLTNSRYTETSCSKRNTLKGRYVASSVNPMRRPSTSPRKTPRYSTSSWHFCTRTNMSPSSRLPRCSVGGPPIVRLNSGRYRRCIYGCMDGYINANAISISPS